MGYSWCLALQKSFFLHFCPINESWRACNLLLIQWVFSSIRHDLLAHERFSSIHNFVAAFVRLYISSADVFRDFKVLLCKTMIFFVKFEQIFLNCVYWRNPWLILLLVLWHFFATTWQWTCHEIKTQKSYLWECKVTTSKSGDNLKKSKISAKVNKVRKSWEFWIPK